MNVLLVFGGRSVEHEVSIRSAAFIYEGLIANNYEVTCAGICPDGLWYKESGKSFFAQIKGHQTPVIGKTKESVPIRLVKDGQFVELMGLDGHVFTRPDIVFPITHGTYGEDGSLQGFLKHLGIAFVGCDICASACTMDKDMTKKILRDSGINVALSQTVYQHEREKYTYEFLVQKLGNKLFIKPASQGSSVGTMLVTSREDYKKGLDLVFQFDNKALVEECIVGREIEFSILGNEDPEVSVPGEILLNEEFYSYEGKYINGSNGLIIPAKISDELIKEGQAIAVTAYSTLGCEGLSRVDFFLRNDKEWIINEINTLPGFTSISMYPKLWDSSGKGSAQLIKELILLGLARYKKQAGFKTTVN